METTQPLMPDRSAIEQFVYALSVEPAERTSDEAVSFLTRS